MIATAPPIYNMTAAAANYDYVDPMTGQRHSVWYEDPITVRHSAATVCYTYGRHLILLVRWSLVIV